MTTSKTKNVNKSNWKSVINIQPQEIIHFVFMLVGIVCKQLYDGLVNDAGFSFSTTRFFIGLIISPIFYTIVYAQLKAKEDDTVTVISATLAFQNGFFWETILSGLNDSL